MDLGLPSKVKPNRPFDNTFEPYRNWNYKKIVVKPNTALQNQKFYVSQLKELQTRNEKESGIEFVINDDNSYQDFIALIDAMSISKQDTYGVDMEKTGHFFAVHFYKDPNIKEIVYDSFSCYVFTGKEYTPSFFEKAQQFLTKLPKESYYIIFSFLLFMHVSMLSIKERFQLHH